MICFLTSRTDPPDSDHLSLNPANGFIDALRRVFPSHCSALYICSDPDNWEKMDYYAATIQTSFENSGLPFERLRTLDARNEAQAASLVRSSDLLILSGGHVPTQNRFFQKIGLKDLLRGFDGVLIGISAGSMNCAETVYAHPELEGEAVDPAYQRFLPGLGLTRKQIIPHYQAIKDEMLDGLCVMEDIAYPDSRGRRFTLLPDGSYLFIDNGREEIRGEAYLLADGVLSAL
ncbi:MAG: Type 1 glutamine amidotransferase-like domain-containing protein [Oscillospiraceae bacterium]|nr:Type 1 glutamine amidotransferase-like domain-containing protein [Oscillospiraceae bacterium]